MNSLPNKLFCFYQYTKERFSLWQFGLLAIFLGLTAGFLTQFNIYSEHYKFFPLFLGCCALFLFLFRLRLFDEFKDADHDAIYYPDRPVPRGLIKLSALKPIIVLTIVMEVCISLLAGINSIIIFIICFTYSLILFKEFFISKWLKKHFTLYILLHELIAFPLFIYVMSINGLQIFQPHNVSVWVVSFFLVLELFLLEITRKIRANDTEIGSNDTYTSQYGIKGALWLILVVLLLITGSYFYLILSYNVTNILLYLVFPILLFVLINICKFSLNRTEKNAKTIFFSSILFVFTLDFIFIYLLIW